MKDKIRNNSMYSDSNTSPVTADIEKGCREVLDKYYDRYIVAGQITDESKYIEANDGGMVKGGVFINCGKTKDKNTARGHLAMMILDVVEAFCDDEDETETFLEALHRTAKFSHDRARAEEDESDEKHGYTSNEKAKIEILKSFFRVGTSLFSNYAEEEKYLLACMASLVPSLLMDRNNGMKEIIMKEMKEASKGNIGDDNQIWNISQVWLSMIKDCLAAVDDGKDPAKILQEFEETISSLKLNQEKETK